MGNIFKNSSLTIAAEASDNPNIGLYQGTSKSRRRLFRVSCHSEELNLKGSILVGRNNFGDRPFRGPLSSRAWTFQETILAHRVIRFAKGQIWWRCHEHECNERDPDAFCSRRRPNNTMWQVGYSNFLITKEASFFNMPSLQRQRRAFWYFLIEEFVSRKITYGTDILPAIPGLAKEVQRHFQYKYIAGLWLNTIHTDLLWHSPKKGAIRRNIYIALSWSWASIDFSVPWKRTKHSNYAMFDLAARTPIAEVVDVTVMNIKNDPFGQVESGRLQIRAPCREVCSCHIPDHFFDCQLVSLLEDDSDNGCDHGIAENCEFLCRPYKCNVEAFDKRPCCKAPAVCHESLIFLHVASSAQESKGEAERQAHGLILRFKNQTANEF